MKKHILYLEYLFKTKQVNYYISFLKKGKQLIHTVNYLLTLTPR